MSNMIDALYTATVDEESCIAFLDIHGFLPISKGFAQLLNENPDEIRSRLWQKLDDILRKSITKCQPTAIREVGGDAWLLVFPSADNAILWALFVIQSVRDEFMRIKIGIDWGAPRLTKGGALDQSSIMAFKIVEGARKAQSNQILVTEKVKEQIQDQSLCELCRFVGSYKVRFLGKTRLYQVMDGQ